MPRFALARLSHSEWLASFLNPGNGLRFRRDGNFNVITLFEAHIIPMFVSKGIFNTQVSIPVVGPVNSDLCPFGLVRTWRWDDFVNDPRHGDTWLFPNSRSIQTQFRYSCRPRHTRLLHVFHDAV